MGGGGAGKKGAIKNIYIKKIRFENRSQNRIFDIWNNEVDFCMKEIKYVTSLFFFGFLSFFFFFFFQIRNNDVCSTCTTYLI